MTRILWHSAAPFEGTGYGQQTAIWCRYLRDQGHDVAISSYHGGQGQVVEWEGIPVSGPPIAGYSSGYILRKADLWKADVIICLADVWLMNPAEFGKHKTICWAPVDATPLSIGDTHFFYRGGENIIPLAMSEFGKKQLENAGFKPYYIPHGIDTVNVFKPDPDREALRYAYGIPQGAFCIGINSNNIDPIRKGMGEQFQAFRQLVDSGVDAYLFLHTIDNVNGSINLPLLARSLNLGDRVRLADQFRMQQGLFPAEEMARWYSAMDIVSNCAFGEGFGLAAIEAQACGTPVVLSDGSTGRQVVGPGWLVKTEPFWNYTHNSWWHRPSIPAILGAYKEAYRSLSKNPFKRRACRAFAEKYDYRIIGPQWDELLQEVCDGKESKAGIRTAGAGESQSAEVPIGV